jgi:predicted hotdog family 3-hydroxylacyl-ACP dehydratase
MRLDRTWIERHIPHHGRMCLLDEVIEWDGQHIRCRSGTHRAADHPLRSRGRLGVACGVEYAAQAMAAHGALSGGAPAPGGTPAGGVLAAGSGTTKARPEAGFLASVRDVRLYVPRLDDIDADLICEATLIASGQGTALYEFALTAEARRLLSGRATVVFDAGRLNI